jgi:hypothetical protein
VSRQIETVDTDTVCVSLKHRLVVVCDKTFPVDDGGALCTYNLDTGSIVQRINIGAFTNIGMFGRWFGTICMCPDESSVLVCGLSDCSLRLVDFVKEQRFNSASRRFCQDLTTTHDFMFRPSAVCCNKDFVCVTMAERFCSTVVCLSWDEKVLFIVKLPVFGNFSRRDECLRSIVFVSPTRVLVTTDMCSEMALVDLPTRSAERVCVNRGEDTGIYAVLPIPSTEVTAMCFKTAKDLNVRLWFSDSGFSNFGAKMEVLGKETLHPVGLAAVGNDGDMLAVFSETGPSSRLLTRNLKSRLVFFRHTPLRLTWIQLCVKLSIDSSLSTIIDWTEL